MPCPVGPALPHSQQHWRRAQQLARLSGRAGTSPHTYSSISPLTPKCGATLALPMCPYLHSGQAASPVAAPTSQPASLCRPLSWASSHEDSNPTTTSSSAARAQCQCWSTARPLVVLCLAHPVPFLRHDSVYPAFLSALVATDLARCTNLCSVLVSSRYHKPPPDGPYLLTIHCHHRSTCS